MALSEGDTSFDGINVHFWEGGSGFPILMIHGSGPGASTLGNWRLVLEPLAERYHIVAADLIGFGRSGRKKAPPYFDFDLWLRQAEHMLERFPEREVGIIGHSLSGAIALKLAARHARVTKVLTTGSMGARFTPNEHTERVWTFPETRDDLRATAECLVYDKSVITAEYLDNRMKVLHSDGYADYFRAMFAGDKQGYIDAAVLSDEELKSVRCDVLMVHGRNDQPFPYELTTLPIAEKLPQADVLALGRCGHSPALEHPAKLLKAVEALFG